MKKKDPLDDLELFIDPTPLTKEEKVNLSAFIRKLKAGNKKNKATKIVGNKKDGYLKGKPVVSSKH